MKTPTTEDMLRSLGLMRIEEPAVPTWVAPAAMFGAGVAAGAAAALLVAPKSGKELRKDLSAKASDLGETVVNALPDMSAVNPFSRTAPYLQDVQEIEAK
ncbi:MAG: YtxH domain-containing protein [Myxococcota bacterium]